MAKSILYAAYVIISKMFMQEAGATRMSMYKIFSTSKWRMQLRSDWGSWFTIRCSKDGSKFKYINFDLGSLPTVCKRSYPGYVYVFDTADIVFWKVVEEMCRVSDEGYDICFNRMTVLPKYSGAKLLIDIDLLAPDYAYLDEPVKVPF